MVEDLVSLARRPDEEIDLVRAALLIAREEYAKLDVDAWCRRVRTLAEQARGHVGAPGRAVRRTLERLNEHFFGRLGFRGNDEDYYDPRNSYLNDVLDRRLGIPITLGVLYCDIGRRLGLPLRGISFPGHFLVRCGDRGPLVDCFGARLVDRDDCQALLDATYSGRMRLAPGMMRESAPRETLARMLTNLRMIFAARSEVERALRFAELGVRVMPENAELYRERAKLLLQAQQFGRAVADLEEYQRRAPGAPDAAAVREQLTLARQLLARVN